MTKLFTDARIKAMYLGGWTSEDHDELIDTYDITSEEADVICAKLAELEEADRPTTRDHMIANPDENLGWCKPVQVGDLVFAQNEGKIILAQWGDEEAYSDTGIYKLVLRFSEQTLGAETAASVVEGISTDRPAARSRALAEELTLSCVCGEMGCYHCPWFGVCDAMND